MADAGGPLTAEELRARLDPFPRLPLGAYPTPLQPAPGLSRELGRTVLVKREDLSGLAFGGNKVRHMELLMAEVRRAGADTVINIMGYHSNNARLAAAACVRAGFRYHVFLRHAAGMPVQGNSLVDHLLGAAVHLLNEEESERDMELARGVAERLRRAGAVPYVMNDELFPKLAGMIGFADAGLELAGQLRAAAVSGPVRVVCVAGRSLCGLALASLNLGLDWRFTGVRVASAPALDDYIFSNAETIRQRLDLPLTFAPADFDVVERYAGPGGPAPAVLEAVRLAARTDGLMVDPNYTGVALAGLIDRIADGAVGADETVVFVHTGGTPAIFSYAAELVPPETLAVTP
ncbi:MAG: pyridoxal-phosphate dependent enzyme [Spirochaetaceae bacterium]|nr:pyridoxal-phosphate dependent enzyme [Spirochaetaceae bacterium]